MTCRISRWEEVCLKKEAVVVVVVVVASKAPTRPFTIRDLQSSSASTPASHSPCLSPVPFVRGVETNGRRQTTQSGTDCVHPNEQDSTY